MAEHGLDGARPILGFAFDGTGYGPDDAIWGGEVLLADYKGYRRRSHFKYVPLPGGDVSVLRPYRMALSHLWAAGLGWDEDLPPVRACPTDEQRVLSHQLETGLRCAPTSSMGRLFDAVSALVGVRQVVAYEAQAAIELEGLSRDADSGTDGTPSTSTPRTPAVIDPAPVLAAIIRDLRDGGRGRDRRTLPPRRRRLDRRSATAERSVTQTVALSGGVFQNALLLRLA